MTYREICLEEAKRIVCRNRELEYGSPEDSFQQIRELWEAYLGMPLAPHDVAMMMALLKIARIKSGNFKEDSFIDAAGYIACGYEIARWCEIKDEARRESDRNFQMVRKGGDPDKAGTGDGTEEQDKAKTGEEARGETGKRGENVTREDSEAQSENDTPPDTDTQTDTDPQTQTQFQFGVRDGKTKTAEEREAEIESCVAYGLRESQKDFSPVLRDAQRGIGPGFVHASPNGPGLPVT